VSLPRLSCCRAVTAMLRREGVVAIVPNIIEASRRDAALRSTQGYGSWPSVTRGEVSLTRSIIDVQRRQARRHDRLV